MGMCKNTTIVARDEKTMTHVVPIINKPSSSSSSSLSSSLTGTRRTSATAAMDITKSQQQQQQQQPSSKSPLVPPVAHTALQPPPYMSLSTISSYIFVVLITSFIVGYATPTSSATSAPSSSSSSSSTSSGTAYRFGWETTTVVVPTKSPASVSEMVEETGFYQSIRLTDEEPLYVKQSKYQLIEVRRSPYYGKLLVLDGVVQITERDGNSYNEMLSHIPMFQNTHPQRVLVIGGGDGYVVSEVLKHESVVHVDHVDLDTDVIETCKQFFQWSDCWKDPRVTLHIADGANFVRNAPNQSYDVIIQDSSDPWKLNTEGEQIVLPSSVLYAPQHFQHIHRILKPNGVFNMQAESLQIPSDLDGIQRWRNLALSVGFQRAMYGSIMISSYPTGQIGFLLCEKDCTAASPLDHVERRFNTIVANNKSTTYYHPPLQAGSFVLPLWAMKHIYHGNSNNVNNHTNTNTNNKSTTMVDTQQPVASHDEL